MIWQRNKKLYDSPGFTLIELLVSVFIIGLISGLFLVNYHNTSKRSDLKLAIQKVASDIRLAQNYSLGSKTYNGTTIPSGGWGITFNRSDSSYIIFADKDGDYTYDSGEAMETRTLPTGVTIDSLRVNGLPRASVDIVFFPPDPTTYINKNLNNTSARIELKENINNSTAAVNVNLFGLIDVE